MRTQRGEPLNNEEICLDIEGLQRGEQSLVQSIQPR